MASALTLNVGAASVERALRIRDWLRARPEDLIVLTETSAGDGSRLLIADLEERGFVVASKSVRGDRGVTTAVRGVPAAAYMGGNVSLPGRMVGHILQSSPFEEPTAVVGVYAPSRDRTNGRGERKRIFLETAAEELRRLNRRVGGRLLLFGDFNAIARDHEPRHSGFLACEYEWHDRLSELGLRNAHSVLDQQQPHSWIGRTGNRYLYDYAMVGRPMQHELGDCTYLMEPVDCGLSDHAAVAVTFIEASRTSVSYVS